MTLTNGEELEFEESGAHLERAYAHTDADELEDALRECDRAIEMVPGWAEAHNLRGVILDEMERVDEAIAAYEEAVRLDASFEEAVKNLAEAREERRGGRPKWKKVVALVIPIVVLIVAIVVVAVLEVQRGPDWQLELDEYISQSALPSETVTVQSVVEASKPWNFSEEMGTAARDDWKWGSVAPLFPPEAVQCVLLERSRESTIGVEEESGRQVVFVAYHTDALYRAGWLAYVGPKEPFTQELAAHLATIGCDLGLK
jgi:tetratricopeptide (TPR) repeat protein